VYYTRFLSFRFLLIVHDCRHRFTWNVSPGISLNWNLIIYWDLAVLPYWLFR
jgi:hypothetical protein